MKSILVSLLLSASFLCAAQSPFNFQKDMLWIGKAGLFVCKYEVTNIEYKNFIDDLIKDVSDSTEANFIYKNYFPDTMAWIQEFKNHMGDPMTEYYYQHIAFNGYPVVGISYESAVKYCEWLTKKYGEGKYIFRLPEKEEFIRYAKAGDSHLSGGWNAPRNDKGDFLFNYKPDQINLDDDTYRVYYNPDNNSFLRRLENPDSTEWQKKYFRVFKQYSYYVDNSLNGYFYMQRKKGFIKVKIQDSILFYNKETRTFEKEKTILYTRSSHYKDGYMYTCADRIYKGFEEFNAFDENGNIKDGFKITLLDNQSVYPSDKTGLYHLSGNVCEMVREKGCAMGGHWNSSEEGCYYDAPYYYERSSVLVGFRVVAEPVK